jgi:hypothetical protein
VFHQCCPNPACCQQSPLQPPARDTPPLHAPPGRGDQQHFVRRDELRASWAIFTPLLHDIDVGKLEPLSYEPGSRGPEGMEAFLAAAGYQATKGYVWRQRTQGKL